ncbi:hypothetical protein [Paracoccus denitrificans]|jgi:hypothetical protein|uniref:Uncharacterized protein n=1 Tax=Paracoccus denitrificans (strain Pd 1222) TaxID=318586 RepID=A1B0N3_PARDP|nr:hypothetical protein [Paracoccus denitrificans]ABL69077.1 hypothetical protein Pden_0966 [Paracoccus denitrificans PD1222]MBB4630032.1 hypothetical protein [Paracoccus denitrificans]MCU7431592.1 hypothetical protein [Paracoccus denitrificans]QAR27109.1 hypothetical protein EO213_12790 [Paracoccus denitrificans]UPV96072.1 hypothetical protein M0K93_05655 [Paracoccus denitrificans]
MTSDIVSVEIGRSTWQGPAEDAPRRAHITRDDLVSALEQIEMLTATGSGLDPDTTMQVHLLAGIGRATHDPYAWYSRSDLCASGQQVRALVDAFEAGLKAATEIVADDRICEAILARDNPYSALTPAPQAATPTAQELVPVRWLVEETLLNGSRRWSCFEYERQARQQAKTYSGTVTFTPLFAHPPQPSETVAEAATAALNACRIIDAAALEGHDNVSDLICHLLEAVEPARAALRALKGGA